jgi:hypothetical protein
VTLTTLVAGVPGNVGLLPLEGSLASAPDPAVTSGIISTDPSDSWVGQVLPGNETITAVSATFNESSGVGAGGLFFVSAAVYVSSNGGLTYSPVLSMPLPPLAGPLPPGAVTSTSVSGLSVALPAGDLAAVVFSATGGGISLVGTVTGSATAGVSYTSG